MAGTTIKLQTNIPVTGVVEYVDYIKTTNPDYKDQIAVRGKFDAGEGRIYLPLGVEGELFKIGLVGPKQANGNYPVLLRGAKVKFLKTENGNSRFTNIEILER